MWIPQENENCQGQSYSEPQTSPRAQALNNSVKLPFPKKARLLSKYQFQKIFKEGQRLSGRNVTFQYRVRETTPCPKLGITISKKFGKAHIRNRFKRVVREAFREVYPFLPSGLELNVLPRLYPEKISKNDILNDLSLLLSKTLR